MDSNIISAPKAVICICNQLSLKIWDIRHGIDDEVLVSFNADTPQWCVLHDTDNEGCYFVYGETTYRLQDAMRL